MIFIFLVSIKLAEGILCINNFFKKYKKLASHRICINIFTDKCVYTYENYTNKYLYAFVAGMFSCLNGRPIGINIYPDKYL